MIEFQRRYISTRFREQLLIDVARGEIIHKLNSSLEGDVT